MAKDFKILGQLVIDDKGNLKILGKEAKKASKNVESVGTSAHSADRRLKGAAQASSNTTKNFSKMTQGINGGLVPAYATLAASLFAVSAVFRGLETAANIKNQIAGMKEFGAVTGQNMLGITQSIRDATAGIIDFQTAAQTAAITTSAGFNPEQVIKLAEGAKLASVALGRDLTDSLNRVIRGVTKAEPELLDELGIILRLDTATKKYADKYDLVANKLTIAQRQAAVYEEVQGQLNDKFGDFADQADKLVNPFAALQTSFSDIIVGISKFIGPLEVVAKFLSENAGAAATLFGAFAASIFKSAFPALTDITVALDNYALKAKTASATATASFKSSAATFKASATDMTASDSLRSAKSRAILRKLGADERIYNMTRVADQKRSITQLINNEIKRTSANKKLKEGELAHLRTIHKAMEASHISMLTRMGAATKAAGAALSVAIIAPAALAQRGIAAVGTAATKLAPIFAALGSVINAAFFIFTGLFLAKFIYELLFVTEEYKEEQKRLNEELDRTAQNLEHINATGVKIFKEAMEDTEEAAENINKSLLRTFRLLSGLQGAEDIIRIVGEDNLGTTFKDIDRKQREAILNITSQQLSGIFSTQGSAALAGTVRAILAEATKNIPDFVLGDLPNKITGKGGLIERILGLDNITDPEEKMKALNRILTNKTNGLMAFIMQIQGLSGDNSIQAFLDLFGIIVTTNEELEQSTKGVGDLDDAFKALNETLSNVQSGYRPTSFQAFAASSQDVLNALNNANLPKNTDIGSIIKERLGIDIGDTPISQIKEQLQKGVDANTKLPGLLEDRGDLNTELSALKLRKDANSRLLAIEKKKEIFTKDIAIQKNKIAQKESTMVGLSGQSLINAQVQLAAENDKLAVLEAQEREYIRANSVMGKLQDTFATGIESMFKSIIDGSMTAKEAFAAFAQLVIAKIAEIAAAQAAANLIAGAISAAGSLGFGGGSGGGGGGGGSGALGGPGAFRYGGITGYRNGGIAYAQTGGVFDGKDSGYPAILHGREAVVPLGTDGNAIPVEFKNGGMGNVNNSVVNVTVNSDGNTSMTEQESSSFGRSIQAVVLAEISRQQRPGGLLRGG